MPRRLQGGNPKDTPPNKAPVHRAFSQGPQGSRPSLRGCGPGTTWAASCPRMGLQERSLVGYSSRDRKELDTTECTHIYTGDTREKLKPFVVREGSQLSWGRQKCRAFRSPDGGPELCTSQGSCPQVDEKKCDLSHSQCCLIRSEVSVRQAGLALSHSRQTISLCRMPVAPTPQAQSFEEWGCKAAALMAVLAGADRGPVQAFLRPVVDHPELRWASIPC